MTPRQFLLSQQQVRDVRCAAESGSVAMI